MDSTKQVLLACREHVMNDVTMLLLELRAPGRRDPSMHDPDEVAGLARNLRQSIDLFQLALDTAKRRRKGNGGFAMPMAGQNVAEALSDPSVTCPSAHV